MEIDLARTIEALGKAGRLVLAAHSDPDGDALGSMLGLAHMLQTLGKETWLYRDGMLPVDYMFLPGSEEVREQLPDSGWPDMVVLLDCHQAERAGTNLARWLPAGVKVLVLDHHLGDAREEYLVHKDPGYSAAAELVAIMLRQAGWRPSRQAAMCLYAGIIGDTGNFTQGNTTGRVLEAAGWLVEQGANPEELSLLSRTITLRRMQLHGSAWAGIQGFIDGRVFLTRVSQRDLAGRGCTLADLEGLLEPLRFIEGGLVVALLKELNNDEVKVSLRSRRHVDVSRLAQLFGGGGHKNAAGFKVKGSLDSVQAEFLRQVRQLLENTSE